MAAIICELCGSNEVVKQDGYFVCQHCGTKYSLEEAKKMLGTVQIDNSNFVEKYLQNARRAKEKEDWEETEKYYNMVEQNDPDNIEAIFYSAYGKAKASLTSDDIYKRQAIFNSLQKCISIIDDHYDPEKEAELRPVIEQISNDIIGLSGSKFVYTQTTNSYDTGARIEYSTYDNSGMTYDLFNSLNTEFASSLANIIEKLNQTGFKEVDYLFERMILHLRLIVDGRASWSEKKQAANSIDKYQKQWHEINPEHLIPSTTTASEVTAAERREVEATVRQREEQEAANKTGTTITWLLILGFIIFMIIAAQS